MKPFEERYTAWIDGTLKGEELQRFEEELSQHPEAVEDRKAAHQLGRLLRDFGGAPPLRNPDFFNHQLLAMIEAEQAPARREAVGGARFRWSFGRWAWLGGAACAAGVAFVLSLTLLPKAATPMIAASSPSMAQIVDAQAVEAGVWVTALHSEADDVAVLWIDGLDYLPASYQLQ